MRVQNSWTKSYDFNLQRQRCKFYKATGSLARFENKNILFFFENRSSPLQRWRCAVCKFKSRRIGSWAKFGLKTFRPRQSFMKWIQGGVRLPRVRVPHSHLRHGRLGEADGQPDPGEDLKKT
jgi:hypothetical protein